MEAEESLVRAGWRGSRGGFSLNRQQLYAAPGTAAAQQSPAYNFHGGHIRKSHGEIFFSKLSGRRTKAFVTVNKLGAFRTRRAIKYKIKSRRNWFATNYDRPELHHACQR